MKRVRLLFAAVLAMSSMVLVSPPAHACPDPDNPCDIQPYEVPDLYCKVLKKC